MTDMDLSDAAPAADAPGVPSGAPAYRTSPAPASADPPRRRHTARWIAVTVLVVSAGLIAVLATRPPAAVSEVQSPLVGKLAPAVSGLTVDGRPFSLPRAPGTWVVLNFFASWCVPCQTEGPDLVAFSFQHQKTGDARVVSVVFDDTASRPAATRPPSAPRGRPWPTRGAPSP